MLIWNATHLLSLPFIFIQWQAGTLTNANHKLIMSTQLKETFVSLRFQLQTATVATALLQPQVR